MACRAGLTDNAKRMFEDLAADLRSVTARTCNFLGIDFEAIPSSAFHSHAKRSSGFRSYRFQLAKNRFFQASAQNRYATSVPLKGAKHAGPRAKTTDYANLALRRANQTTSGSPPQINPGTKKFLDEYFSVQLRGIDELTNERLYDKWF